MNDIEILIGGLWKIFTIWWPAIIFITGIFIYLAIVEKEIEQNRQSVKRAVERERRSA